MSRSHYEIKVYEFRIEGRIDTCWGEWFEGLSMRYEIHEQTGLFITVLSGPVTDQAALHGILEKISRLNFMLCAANPINIKKE